MGMYVLKFLGIRFTKRGHIEMKEDIVLYYTPYQKSSGLVINDFRIC